MQQINNRRLGGTRHMFRPTKERKSNLFHQSPLFQMALFLAWLPCTCLPLSILQAAVWSSYLFYTSFHFRTPKGKELSCKCFLLLYFCVINKFDSIKVLDLRTKGHSINNEPTTTIGRFLRAAISIHAPPGLHAPY